VGISKVLAAPVEEIEAAFAVKPDVMSFSALKINSPLRRAVDYLKLSTISQSLSD
jgi:hypothetical protein